MEAARIIKLAEVLSADNPPSGYRSLYPKADGWYMRDSLGVEHKISSVVINGNSTDAFSFGVGFAVDIVEGVAHISIDNGPEGIPIHGNDAHSEAYITAVDLDFALDNAGLHEQGTDDRLDKGGPNEVTAEQLKQLININQQSLSRNLVEISVPETTVDAQNEIYLADCTDNNVEFILDPQPNIKYTFRHVCGTYAMTVWRGSTESIKFNCEQWDGITCDQPMWFTLMFSNGNWHVVSDSGLTAANQAFS